MSNAKIFIVLLDKNANIVSFNIYASWLTGYSAEDVVGKNWFETFIDTKDMDSAMEVFDSALNEDKTYWEFTNGIVLKDRSIKKIRWSNTILRDNNGAPEYIYSSGTLSN